MLVLTPRFPYPVIGGDRLRIYQLCKVLSRHYSLSLLSLCDSREELMAPIPSDGVFDRVERVYLPRWRSIINVILALPGTTPLQVAYYDSAAFGSRVGELIAGHDVCLSHLIRAGDYTRNFSGHIRILEMTDAISLNYMRVRAIGKKRNIKSWIYSIEASRLLCYEREVVSDFDLVTLVSEKDREFLLERKCADHVLVCSNGVNVNEFHYSERTKGKLVIAFIGNITSMQNLDACLHFVEDIMPLLRKRLDIVFRVVGKINESDATHLRQFDGVEVTGGVDSIPEAVSDAWIGVCPVRIGAGVQNKVLEYMALGLPTITSTVGLEGFSAVPGYDVLVADSADDYLHHMLKLNEDTAFGLQLARNARKYVEKNHDWSSQLTPLLDAISEKLLERQKIDGANI
jgi:glycosyltransferase involved in cell wall biosynthesis